MKREILILFPQKKQSRILSTTAFVIALIISQLLLLSMEGSCQNAANILKGKILNPTNEPIPSATIKELGNTRTTISNKDGYFELKLKNTNDSIRISCIGFDPITIAISDALNREFFILTPKVQALDDIIVVGYGKQKKESVVGAITQTTGKILQRAGGVTNLGMALAGNLPGVTVSSSTGMPGAEDPQILIRGQTSWNNSSPLILVDGIERSISSIDIASVASISVLKDASATAVFGVKGANGVILITTKQGAPGKANIQILSNMTVKTASKLPKKYDSYDALMIKNQVIERELPVAPNGWTAITPQQLIEKYRNPSNNSDWDRYPNVDWVKELFKNYTTSNNTSVNVSGGSKFVNYFSAVDFVTEGDLFKTFQNNRGYKSGFGYTRLNVRSNLDFTLTPTTKFSTKLFGSSGVRKVPYSYPDGDASYWASAYRTAPDAFRPIYSDGTWGFYQPRNADVPNSVYYLAMSGVERRTRTQLTSDFILTQSLDMLTKGLSFRGNYSLDNIFNETGRGINDLYNSAQRKWVDPQTGTVYYEQQVDQGTQLDYSDGIRWTTNGGNLNQNATYRRINYALRLEYARKFGKHDVTAMGLVMREKYATGSEFARYREDWVFRATYSYNTKYFFEANGAYNGSEKFGPNNRFSFFPSLSAGWMLSNENFIRDLGFINTLKIRGSWGRIGDDNVGARWLYKDQWVFGGNTLMGSTPASSPYSYYAISVLGNPNISWESVEKKNIGLDYSFLNGKISGSVDVFSDARSNILINGNNRAIPSYFGVNPPMANLGKVKSHGYEIVLNLEQRFKNNIRLWGNVSVTHAVNKTIFRDDPDLLAAYLKNAGYAIGQTRTYLNDGYLKTWDDIYGSVQRSTNNGNKLVGDYNIVDFNGDGVIDQNDVAPYGFTGTPQNTYSANIGLDWKGFSIFLQFYGVNNVTREITFPTFQSSSNVAYVEGAYWTKDNGGSVPYPRWSSLLGPDGSGTRYLYDGSFIRLKNAEVSYTFRNAFITNIGMKSLRLYLNGNNLLLWTKMPDDRESNFSGNSSFGAYPTMRRFNLGVDINL